MSLATTAADGRGARLPVPELRRQLRADRRADPRGAGRTRPARRRCCSSARTRRADTAGARRAASSRRVADRARALPDRVRRGSCGRLARLPRHARPAPAPRRFDRFASVLLLDARAASACCSRRTADARSARPRHPQAAAERRTADTLAAQVGIPAMMFSTKAEYGVRVMVELAGSAGERADAAGRDRRARRPAARLPGASRRAPAQGRAGRLAARLARRLLLARPAAEITMAEVVEALEGSIAPIECISEAADGSIVCSRESAPGPASARPSCCGRACASRS